MKLARVLAVTVIGVSMLATGAFAKDTKIGYVDLGFAVREYQKTKDFDASLQKEVAEFQKQREGLVNKLRDGQGKLALLKDNEKQKLIDELEKAKTDLIAMDKDKGGELSQKRNDKLREILLDVEKVVSGISDKEGYDYVLNNETLIFASKANNLTDKVLKALNDSYKK